MIRETNPCPCFSVGILPWVKTVPCIHFIHNDAKCRGGPSAELNRLPFRHPHCNIVFTQTKRSLPAHEHALLFSLLLYLFKKSRHCLQLVVGSHIMHVLIFLLPSCFVNCMYMYPMYKYQHTGYAFTHNMQVVFIYYETKGYMDVHIVCYHQIVPY